MEAGERAVVRGNARRESISLSARMVGCRLLSGLEMGERIAGAIFGIDSSAAYLDSWILQVGLTRRWRLGAGMAAESYLQTSGDESVGDLVGGFTGDGQ